MNFGETDEQQMIRELVRDFAETVLAPTVEHRDQNKFLRPKSGKPSLNTDCTASQFPRSTAAHPSMMYPRPSSLKSWHGWTLPSPSCTASMSAFAP